jgi:cellulose synthase/poly-beta-1,6-N-acetylglucosamine synthase-like glycosyltransferase
MKKVSIVIPCRNEIQYISKCLDSIINANYDKEFLKVFVCDGESDDGTIDIIKMYERKHSFIQYVKNEKRTTPFALNLGLKTESFDVAIILGAHAEIHPDFILNNILCLEKYPEVGCCGGTIENIDENKVSLAISKAMSSVFGVGNAHFRTGEKSGYVDTVAFGAYRKEVFDQCGFFDEELARNQDDEFNFRILKSGYKIFLDPEIRSKYYVRGSFRKLWRQYFQYGYWKVYVNKKHQSITTVRQLIPAFMVSGFFTILLLSFVSHYFFGLLFGALIFYVITSLFFALKKSESILETLKIIYTFFILHFSYGLGYVKGLINFIILNRKPDERSKKLSR